MDKIMIATGFLFFAADVFALTSVFNPVWVVSHGSGAMTMGLISQCLTIFGRDTVCIPPNLCPAWQMTLLFIVCAIICLTITCIMFVYSHRRITMLDHARWFSFAAIILLCLAAIIFPIGFYVDEIGGEPYKLPSTVTVGSSYVIFLISIVLMVISELLAGKLCTPLFVVRG
ncbi:uncharacterized protein C16orf52 homolog A-like isoform X2 [Strongylocentrotus purpuratus]|uniref:Modulator of smoothened protein n=1 Tax=Strongylocentrotus purpuratus TaxID=7668 RepID=A0A7M7NS48_STRPU|nr:uncharacterized protein C16orf52 homolog A-like isoform X2 [Strongylocentrotus purpuratus]|eukprot:XP_011662787.1 PREDICTED: uncharacterized protein C16orf52 homolog A isoform X2 [Strongylocentrotus purpuratus]